eukprot:3253942-Amphidinium_carterae.1
MFVWFWSSGAVEVVQFWVPMKWTLSALERSLLRLRRTGSGSVQLPSLVREGAEVPNPKPQTPQRLPQDDSEQQKHTKESHTKDFPQSGNSK